ncbi:MAG: hypothetical protein KA383_04245 [Phycisphaerae bacterium]|nr:hypothetical protein [Phycisphaerae bacterium]HQL54148.1 hypothetical protein [Phycisphaerae bacterium]
MTNQQGQAFEDLRNTLSGCLRIIRHRWRLALIGLSVVGSAAFWYSQFLPREYTATTLFERRDDAVLQNLIQSNSPYSFSHMKTTLTMDMIGSRALLKAAVTAGLLPPETDAGTGALSETERRALDGVLGKHGLRPSVGLLQSSASLDTIQLVCVANDPGMARQFVVAIRDNYITDTRERIRQILTSTRDFFKSEVERIQREIVETEQALQRDFEEFPGLDPTNLVAVGSRLEALRAERNNVQQRKADLEAQIAAREQFLVEAPEYYVLPPDPTSSAPALVVPAGVDPADAVLRKGIESVKAQVVELVTGRRMTMEHPDVKRLLGQLEALEDLRRTLVDATPTPDSVTVAQTPPAVTAVPREWQAQQLRISLELDSLRRQLDATKRQWEEVDARVARFTTLYGQLVENGDELRQLRERRSDRAVELGLWQSHLASLDRIMTAESGERGTQFSLIEEPKNVTLPTKPRVASIFLVCSGLGLAAAALAVALAELFDRSFRSMGQVTRTLGIPVLECVGVIPTPRERRRTLIGRLVWAPTLAALVLALVTTAGLAYASLARPDLHQRTMQRVDHVLNALGVAALYRSDQHSTG